jgi:hypothetical protein
VNIEKALKKLKKILNADLRKQREKSGSLRKVLNSLRLEKERLQAALQDSDSDREREAIVQRLKVLTKQKEKGRQLMDELEEGLVDQDEAAGEPPEK